MKPVYETDLRSLECRQILNSLEVPYVILVFLEKSLPIIHQSNYKITRDNKLRQFHFKLLHRIVVTNKKLKRFVITDCIKCVMCSEDDSIEHVFLNVSLLIM